MGRKGTKRGKKEGNERKESSRKVVGIKVEGKKKEEVK
jgi:hypothetical protein